MGLSIKWIYTKIRILLLWPKLSKTVIFSKLLGMKLLENFAMDLNLILLKWTGIYFVLEIRKELFTLYFQEK